MNIYNFFRNKKKNIIHAHDLQGAKQHDHLLYLHKLTIPFLGDTLVLENYRAQIVLYVSHIYLFSPL